MHVSGEWYVHVYKYVLDDKINLLAWPTGGTSNWTKMRNEKNNNKTI